MDAGLANDSLTLADFDVPVTKSALEAELNSTSIRKKQGHVCLGCCCDTRRAVLIVNVLFFLVTLGMLIILLVGKEVVQWTASHRASDNDLQQDEQELAQVPVGRLLVLWLCQISLYACGVMGAIQFRSPLIWAAILAYVIGLVIAAWYGHVVSIALNLLSIYPHVFFLKEMKNLLMTPENYPNEVYSFCCV
jgi:hypothetical protein